MRKNFVTIELIFTALLATLLSNYIITKYFAARVVNPDLIFKLVPYNLTMEYVSDIFFFIGAGLFIFLYFIPNKARINDMVNMTSLMYIFRALFSILTPMMRPTGVDFPSHGIFRNVTVQMGMFPSGHIGLLALMYFMIQGKEYLTLKKYFLPILIISAVLMVVSRGHYSIDIVGGVMLSYIIVNEYKKRVTNRKDNTFQTSAL